MNELETEINKTFENEVYPRCDHCKNFNDCERPQRDNEGILFSICTSFYPLFDEKATHNELATHIMSKYDFKTMLDTHEIYYYDNGVYVPRGEELITKELERVKNPCNKTFMNEVLNHIQNRTWVDRESFDKDPTLLTLENGVLDIETMQLHEFSPNYLSLVKLPIEYDKDAKCETIEKFLSEIVAKEDVETLYEIAGFLLLKPYFIHKAIMQIGETHSGKSTYQKLLCAMIGEENISHVSIQDLLTNRFVRAELYGKMMNSYADLPNTALKQTGLFKILTGEDKLSAEKKHRDPFEFENNAKLIFSCNEMPKTYDKGDAFFIRWIIINFPNRFDDKNPKTDKKLIEKLTIKEELSGFFNKALARAKVLFEQEHFTNNPNVEEIREYYEKLSNPIYAFINDICLQEDNAGITKREFYDALMKYCEDKNLSKPTTTYTTQEMKRLRFEDGQRHDGSRIWKGIRLKTDEEKKEDKTLDEF